MPASARLSFLAVRWHTQRDSRSPAVYLQVVVSGLLQQLCVLRKFRPEPNHFRNALAEQQAHPCGDPALYG